MRSESDIRTMSDEELLTEFWEQATLNNITEDIEPWNRSEWEALRAELLRRFAMARNPQGD